MDEEIERLVIAVRADTAGFARDVAQMRGELGGGLGEGAERAGRLIEGSLLRAVRGGKLGFDDLRATALRALDDIAGAALRGGVRALLGDGGLGSALAGLLGAPGRATGGPVTAGRAYTVGERGPELFVPTGYGRIESIAAASPREVRVAITVNAAAGTAPGVLMQSSRQVARAVRAALAEG
ncbi:hypothetical protein GCM10022268_02430 [Sphingomonas cynarae]|uniref:Tail tape measure protein n=1 Tax=Sphingomonas cynarae TaxID=930197 RepID=A0ABP7CVK7_9SPHN